MADYLTDRALTGLANFEGVPRPAKFPDLTVGTPEQITTKLNQLIDSLAPLAGVDVDKTAYALLQRAGFNMTSGGPTSGVTSPTVGQVHRVTTTDPEGLFYYNGEAWLDASGQDIIKLLTLDTRSDVEALKITASPGRIVRRAASVDALKAMQGASELVDGDVIEVNSRVSGDDGFAGKFLYDAADTTTVADDAMAIKVPNKPGIVKRLGADGKFESKWFKESSNSWAAAINRAAREAEGYYGSGRVLSKFGAGIVLLPVGEPIEITETIEIRDHGVAILGAGEGVSVLNHRDESIDAIRVASPTALQGGTEGRLSNIVLEGFSIVMANADITDANRARGIVMDRVGLSRVSNVTIQHMYRCIEGLALERGCKFESLNLISTDASALTDYLPEAAQIWLDRREVTASDVLGKLDAADGRYYAPCTMMKFSNIQMHGRGYGAQYNIMARSFDGLHLDNIHLGFAPEAQLCFQAVQANHPMINFIADLIFNDDADNLGNPASPDQTKYGVKIEDPNDLGTNFVDFTFSDSETNAAAEAAFLIDAPNARDITISGGTITKGQKDGIRFVRGQYVMVEGVRFRDMALSGAGESIRHESPGEMEIKDCSFRVGQHHIRTTPGAGKTHQSGNTFAETTDAVVVHQSVAGHTIDGCEFHGSNKHVETTATAGTLTMKGTVHRGATTRSVLNNGAGTLVIEGGDFDGAPEHVRAGASAGPVKINGSRLANATGAAVTHDSASDFEITATDFDGNGTHIDHTANAGKMTVTGGSMKDATTRSIAKNAANPLSISGTDMDGAPEHVRIAGGAGKVSIAAARLANATGTALVHDGAEKVSLNGLNFDTSDIHIEHTANAGDMNVIGGVFSGATNRSINHPSPSQLTVLGAAFENAPQHIVLGASAGRTVVRANSFRDAPVGMDIRDESALETHDFSGNSSDQSMVTIAAAASMQVPYTATGMVSVTGTGVTITNIDSGAGGGKTAYVGMRVHLIFDEAGNTIANGGNFRLTGAETYNSAPNSQIVFQRMANGLWREISRIT